MRRETYEIRGGVPGILLHSETESESRLTPVERGLLLAMLTSAIGPNAAELWVAHARVQVRDFDGYGAHVNLSMPAPNWAADPRFNAWEAWVPETGSSGFFHGAAATVESARCRCLVGAVLLGPTGEEYSIDLHPMDGEGLGHDSIERLLFEAVEHVKIVVG